MGEDELEGFDEAVGATGLEVEAAASGGTTLAAPSDMAGSPALAGIEADDTPLSEFDSGGGPALAGFVADDAPPAEREGGSAAARTMADEEPPTEFDVGGGPATAGTDTDEAPPAVIDNDDDPAAAGLEPGGAGKLDPSSMFPIGSSGVSMRLPSSQRGM